MNSGPELLSQPHIFGGLFALFMLYTSLVGNPGHLVFSHNTLKKNFFQNSQKMRFFPEFKGIPQQNFLYTHAKNPLCWVARFFVSYCLALHLRIKLKIVAI
jgi:hypothetical protein